MKVIKFGGTSVGSADALIRAREITAKLVAADRSSIIVVSAFSRATDQLLAMAKLAANGDSGYMPILQQLAERHLSMIAEFVKGPAQQAANGRINALLGDLADVLHGTLLVRDVSAKILDVVASFGERLSGAVVTEIFNATSPVPFSFVDARELVSTDSTFGNARVDRAETYRRIQLHVNSAPLPWIITGFIGADQNKQTTTLGRGGSDYTASLAAAAMDAAEIDIWTDVDGFMTADPRKVPKAILIPHLSYEEAMELSHFGAKVVYPPTLQPAFEKNIPIRVLNTFKPDAPGTLISSSSADRKGAITGISSISDVALLTIQGSGMVGVAGIASRLFGTLSREKISVILISQASSEHSICFAIEPGYASAAKNCLEREFNLEIAAGQIEPLDVEFRQSILAVVGDRMRSTPGVSGRLFQALGKNGVNIKAIAQGSSELNISTVILQEDEQKALRAVHDSFFLSDQTTVNLFLVGAGRVGTALLRQIQQQRAVLIEDRKLDINVAGVATSKTYVIADDAASGGGLETDPHSSHYWRSRLESSGQPMNLEAFIALVRGLNLPNTIFVDCTASDAVGAAYASLLRSNISVVSANKRANAAGLESYANLHEAAAASTVKFLYETNVGAGLPVINTLQDLLASGDRVHRIEAVLSGTLSFIFNSLTPDKQFSDVVREAHKRGYTEPDPRDDLCGADVARKLLILGREMGLQIEERDVQVESLVPESCASATTAEEFFERLADHDGAFADRAARARANGGKLCYIASLTGGKASVQLEPIGSDHPFYGLSGSDNIISFVTERYSERPLVVRGPGAGTEVTAAGVFADLLRAAGYLR